MKIYQVPKDSIIFNEGDVGDPFYIIFYREAKVEAKKVQQSISSGVKFASIENRNNDEIY